jgi:hypothetical protein
VVTKVPPYFIICIMALFDKQASMLKGVWGIQKKVDASKTTSILGINFIEPKISVLEMSDALIETGYVPASKMTSKK